MKLFYNFLIFCTFVFSEVFAVTIDKMDTLWNIVSDSDTSVNLKISGDANQVEYNFGTGSWIEIYKDTFADLNISSADAISFYFKGSGEKNNLKLQIYDADGDMFDRQIKKVTDISQWTQIIVPFSSLSVWTKDGKPFGDGQLDTKRISKLAFAVTPSNGGVGSIAIDKIESYKLNTKEFFLVDSFNFGTPPNETGGNEGPMSPDDNNDGKGDYDPIVTYDRNNAYEGIYALSLTYNFPAGKWCGYWIFLTSANVNGYTDLSSYTHLKFYIKSDVPGKQMKIELVDTTGTIKSVQLSSYLSGGTQTSYQEVSIPLSDFAGLDLSKVKQINFVFDQSPYSGIVYIDYIRFTSEKSYTGGVLTSIDDMNLLYKISGWANYGRDEDKGITTTQLKNTSGIEDAAIELNYKFNRPVVDIDDWVVMERLWGLNIANYNTIEFELEGTGSSNNLEFKLVDRNNTIYWRKFYNITNTDNVWKKVVIPLEELSLFTAGKDWQGNVVNTLDLTKIKSVCFTISKNAGGSGTVLIKNLGLTTKGGFETKRENKIIKSLKVINNTFSPNNDGTKDKAIFLYELSEPAEVKIVIYNLSGDVVYEEDKGEQQANTELTIEWAGKDKSNNIVRNGLYFYQLIAENNNGSDKITHIVAVIR